MDRKQDGKIVRIVTGERGRCEERERAGNEKREKGWK